MEQQLEVAKGLPSDWDELTADGLWALRRPWLIYEPNRLPGELHTFVLRREGRGDVAGVGTVVTGPTVRRFADPYLLLHDGAPGYPDSARPWADMGPHQVYPCVVLMAPEYDTGLVGPGIDDPTRVAGFVHALEDWAVSEGMRALAALYLGSGATLLSRALEETGYGTIPTISQSILEVTWADLMGYTEKLRSHPGGRNALKELRRRDRLAVRIRLRTLGAHEPQLVELLMEHARRHGTPQTEERADQLLTRIRTTFGEPATMLFIAEAGGQIVSFALFVRDGDDVVSILTGTRYGSPHASASHFHTMFYELATQAPDLGVSRVRYGLGDEETKRRRGCVQIPTAAAFKRFEGVQDRGLS